MVAVSIPQKSLAIGTAIDANGVGAGCSDNNPNALSEEKMKVVVRVRPLQAREEAWSKAGEEDLNLPATITIQVVLCMKCYKTEHSTFCGVYCTTGKRGKVGEEWSTEDFESRRSVYQWIITR